MVSKLRALIAYLSYSSNTAEVAALIYDKLTANEFKVDMHRIGIDPPITPDKYEIMFIGTFTWAMGATPDEVKDFVLEIGYKPENIAVFGTGDTQFGGDDLFCLAAVKLAKFYRSKWKALKIEQSPRGSQEEQVKQWVEGVMDDVKFFTRKSKNIRTNQSK
ncbi:flavodoxin [Caldibacillus lycopersici]|uniref:Flavodoxin n=1 Tax=Perspicuibacillus lycopersici TaxID=1325689 RepID=A0AAE3IW43_9BACI|nr:flavodoxin [Perspicuibacillus lycopersici]MCU9614479.1 flavodoxin [Perspicuibacillus lycopersici]